MSHYALNASISSSRKNLFLREPLKLYCLRALPCICRDLPALNCYAPPKSVFCDELARRGGSNSSLLREFFCNAAQAHHYNFNTGSSSSQKIFATQIFFGNPEIKSIATTMNGKACKSFSQGVRLKRLARSPLAPCAMRSLTSPCKTAGVRCFEKSRLALWGLVQAISTQLSLI